MESEKAIRDLRKAEDADTGLPDILGERGPRTIGICSYEAPTAFLRVEITTITARGCRVR